jgi:hypothetical protein
MENQPIPINDMITLIKGAGEENVAMVRDLVQKNPERVKWFLLSLALHDLSSLGSAIPWLMKAREKLFNPEELDKPFNPSVVLTKVSALERRLDTSMDFIRKLMFNSEGFYTPGHRADVDALYKAIQDLPPEDIKAFREALNKPKSDADPKA